ncbi:RtcB family protein [Polluticoccus soli]|uniref:RtcB family protein n=1 Tax=Polluticoccus soli TaxID=3034150 RepID=UPI0023E2A9DC|nr:RtcB family protein [Flavipsychrobacter sp. JY13-12]
MARLTLTGKELLAIGYPQSPAIAAAITVGEHYKLTQRDEVLEMLGKVAANPADYANDEQLGPVAKLLLHPENDIIKLKDALPYKVYGGEFIEQGAREQMETAMSLPVAVAGALMPDAHHGYGLPIGGVLAADNAIIPYGVGVDIGCRMCLSIYDIPESHFEANQSQYKRELIAHTKFGAGNGFHGQYKADHAILENETFKMNGFLKNLHDKAYSQLGTSGGGNHFVEWGIMELHGDDNELGIRKGKYLALLSHSGSRGLGATIANHYTKLAKELCRLPKEAAQLAYLGLDTEAGMEYWLAMNLAGDYASACHEIIHEKLTKAIGGKLLARIENHHNFAWKEEYEGREVIVHRKGATPAGKGVLGIIPGSMAAPGYLVRGRGNLDSINSASHGAGRQMSRTKAQQTFSKKELSELLKVKGITLIGGGLDEAPGAYKDIRVVMAAQTDLVDIVATFKPKMVRMADDGSRED